MRNKYISDDKIIHWKEANELIRDLETVTCDNDIIATVESLINSSNEYYILSNNLYAKNKEKK